MAEPTIQDLFGANAIQDSSSLTIYKTDFAGVGLTASANNTAESILAAIIAFSQTVLSETNRETNPEQSIVIEDGLPSLITRGDSTFRQNSKSIVFEKLDTQTNFVPDDY